MVSRCRMVVPGDRPSHLGQRQRQAAQLPRQPTHRSPARTSVFKTAMDDPSQSPVLPSHPVLPGEDESSIPLDPRPSPASPQADVPTVFPQGTVGSLSGGAFRDALEAVLEALDIPHAPTLGTTRSGPRSLSTASATPW